MIRQHEYVPDQRVDKALIQKATKFGRTTVRDCIADLIAWGEVERVADGRTYLYRTVAE